MTYPALWRVCPAFQCPFDAPATLLQAPHVADLPCFGDPHERRSLEATGRTTQVPAGRP